MDGISFTFADKSADVITALEAKKAGILEEIGLKTVGFTKENITAAGRVDTGQYRNSITHRVRLDESAVYAGSNLMTAVYNELGTGKFATNGNGRPGYWVYVAGQDKASRAANRATTRKIYTLAEAKRIMAYLRSKGLNAFYTCGMKPIHALQKAASENNSKFKEIIKNKMKT